MSAVKDDLIATEKIRLLSWNGLLTTLQKNRIRVKYPSMFIRRGTISFQPWTSGCSMIPPLLQSRDINLKPRVFLILLPYLVWICPFFTFQSWVEKRLRGLVANGLFSIPLALFHRRNVVRLSLFRRYFHGKCSYELHSLGSFVMY